MHESESITLADITESWWKLLVRAARVERDSGHTLRARNLYKNAITIARQESVANEEIADYLCHHLWCYQPCQIFFPRAR